MPETIRKATSAEAATVWEIRTAAILHGCRGHYPADLLAAWTSGQMSARFVQFVSEKTYVATVNRRIVGTGAINLGNGQLDAVFIHPEMMRRGIGRKIVCYLEQLGQTAALPTLTLESTLNAVPFYRRCGFHGDVVSKYQSPRGIALDCVRMSKHLASPRLDA